jgi:hypothetical protein
MNNMKNVQTKGNGAYMPLNGHDIKDYMLENMQMLNHKLYIKRQGSIRHFINLDDFL